MENAGRVLLRRSRAAGITRPSAPEHADYK